MITLFPLCTSAGWNSVLEAITNEEFPHCNPNLTTNSQISQGDCGSTYVAIPFMISYIIISFLIVVNMYIAVILENFSQVREEVQVGLTGEDYDMYYELWQKYDPNGTEFISYDVLSDFVDKLEEPLGIKKPNRLKLISMDLIICKGNMVHCTDILDALTKNFLGTSDDVEQVALEELKKGKPNEYEPIATTLQIQRQNYAAFTITRGFRSYITNLRAKKEELKLQASRTAYCDTSLTPIPTPLITPSNVQNEILKSNSIETFL